MLLNIHFDFFSHFEQLLKGLPTCFEPYILVWTARRGFDDNNSETVGVADHDSALLLKKQGNLLARPRSQEGYKAHGLLYREN